MIALRDGANVVTRGLRSDDDYEAVAAILEACRVADGYDTARTADQFRAAVTSWPGFEPAEGLRLAVDDGQVVGFAYGVMDGDNPDIGRILYHGGGVLPSWRGRGIGRRLLAEAQAAARRHAARRPGIAPRSAVYRTFVAESDQDARALLESGGYEIVRYGYAMVRPTLADPPSPELPPGLEARATTPETAMQITRAMAEALPTTGAFPEYSDDELAGRWSPPAVGPARRVAGGLGRRRGRGRRAGLHQRGGEPRARVAPAATPSASSRAARGADAGSQRRSSAGTCGCSRSAG